MRFVKYLFSLRNGTVFAFRVEGSTFENIQQMQRKRQMMESNRGMKRFQELVDQRMVNHLALNTPL